MKIASIDIGSNTILLLVVEISGLNNELVTIVNEYRVPRISEGLEKSLKISSEKVSKLILILKEYKDIARSHNCKHIIVNATNAFRIASNAVGIQDKIKDELDLEVNILSGEDEAYLSFQGAKSSFTNFEDVFVLDIGGGSTELIFGNNYAINYRNSFCRGAVNFTEELIDKYPIDEAKFHSLTKHVRQYFTEINSMKNFSKPLISLAGTPTTLSCINKKISEYDDQLIEGSLLTQAEIKKIIEEMQILRPKDILEKYGNVVNGREDVILIGSIILYEVMNLLNLSETYISARGLRYGAVFNFIKDLQ